MFSNFQNKFDLANPNYSKTKATLTRREAERQKETNNNIILSDEA